MKHTEKPPTGLTPRMIRLPDALTKYLKHAAVENNRSLNGEVIQRLEASRKAEEHAREQQGATP